MSVLTDDPPLTDLAASSFPGRFDNPALMRRRRRAEIRFQLYGLAAIAIGLAFLVILFTSIIGNGWTAFFQTSIKLPITFDAQEIDPDGSRSPSALAQANYQKLAYTALYTFLGVDPSNRPQRTAANALLSRETDSQLRQMITADPSLIGQTKSVWVLASGNVDAFEKGRIDRALPQANRQISDQQIAWIDKLTGEGVMQKLFNAGLFTNTASSQPETAGLAVALLGSFYIMLIVALLSVPLGVAAAIYLEEFAPKNRFTDLIEVNINNLAAVPSIVFGLLGLAVFINFAGLPRSASLVGGLVLTLRTLPTVIIATRAAITAVPPSIRQAALGCGRVKGADDLPSRAAALSSGHHHRHDFGADLSPGRDSAASYDRHGGLRGRHSEIAPRSGDRAPRPDLHVGDRGRARLRREDRGRNHRAPGDHRRDEHHRHDLAQKV